MALSTQSWLRVGGVPAWPLCGVGEEKAPGQCPFKPLFGMCPAGCGTATADQRDMPDSWRTNHAFPAHLLLPAAADVALVVAGVGVPAGGDAPPSG